MKCRVGPALRQPPCTRQPLTSDTHHRAQRINYILFLYRVIIKARLYKGSSTDWLLRRVPYFLLSSTTLPIVSNEERLHRLFIRTLLVRRRPFETLIVRVNVSHLAEKQEIPVFIDVLRSATARYEMLRLATPRYVMLRRATLCYDATICFHNFFFVAEPNHVDIVFITVTWLQLALRCSVCAMVALSLRSFYATSTQYILNKTQ